MKPVKLQVKGPTRGPVDGQEQSPVKGPEKGIGRRWKGKREIQADPLYVIFEQHLFNFQDSDLDRKTFVSNVIRDYFSFLRKQQWSIPVAYEVTLTEELFDQVNAMLVKKIYGCLSLQDFQQGFSDPHKKQARAKYLKVIKSPKIRIKAIG